MVLVWCVLDEGSLWCGKCASWMREGCVGWYGVFCVSEGYVLGMMRFWTMEVWGVCMVRFVCGNSDVWLWYVFDGGSL